MLSRYSASKPQVAFAQASPTYLRQLQASKLFRTTTMKLMFP